MVKYFVEKAKIKNWDKEDILLWVFEKEVNYSCTFTLNDVKAHSIIFSQEIYKNREPIFALFANSGNANCLNGKAGYKALEDIEKFLQEKFKTKKRILFAQTGVIGEFFEKNKVLSALKDIKLKPLESKEDLKLCARAIMTTDRFEKYEYVEDGDLKIMAIAKGAGMIAPNMATMLCFVYTNASFSREELDVLLRYAVEKSFNRISVDGDMSTNDCVFLFSEKKGVKVDIFKFRNLLEKVLKSLALKIVEDGEGATKVMHIIVKGAKSKDRALKIAQSIGNSLLVKTAIFGCDPNWGRILAAAGSVQMGIDVNKCLLFIGPYLLFSNGEKVNYDEDRVIDYMKKNKVIKIVLDLNEGNSYEEFFASDISYEYIKINAEYRT